MKIQIDIPDWAKKENLYLVSRTELVAFKMASDKKWKVKIERCNKCGKCCMVHPKEGSYFSTKADGSCIHLVEDGGNKICELGMEKPMACVVGEPEGAEYKRFECSIKYKKRP